MDIIFAILVGLVASVVVNYFSDVLPATPTHKLTRPACPKCGAVFSWNDYLTIAACRACDTARTWRTYLTLVAGVGLSLALWFNTLDWKNYWLGIVVLAFFGLVIVIDVEHRLILHVVTLFGAVLGVVAGFSRLSSPARSLLGGATGFIIMLVLYLLGTLFARYRARKLGVDDGEEALGFGDVTISGVLGLMLGFPNILYALVTGILLAGAYSLALILTLVLRKKFESISIYIAYGPFLVLGSAFYYFFR